MRFNESKEKEKQESRKIHKLYAHVTGLQELNFFLEMGK